MKGVQKGCDSMGKILDLTGKTFGSLFVLKKSDEIKGGNVMWECQCSCGNKTLVTSYNLRSGRVGSCGCQKSKFTSENTLGENNPNHKHNLRNTKLYTIWAMMKQRCSNPNNKNFKDYGGRGITVCEEWSNDVQAFYEWSMKNGYEEGLTIDRIDNDKGYSPDNCRWTTMKVQRKNQRKRKIK